MNVDIEKELYEQITKFVKQDKVTYPSINNFVNKAVRDRLRIELINKKELER